MGLLMQKTTKLYLIIAILAILSCSSYYILNESYGQTNEGESHQETPVLTPDSAGSVHTAPIPTQVSQAMQDDFANMEVPQSPRSIEYTMTAGTLHCDDGIAIESLNPRYNKVIAGTWNADTKVHTPESDKINGFAHALSIKIFDGDVFDGKFHLHGIARAVHLSNVCNELFTENEEKYMVVDVFGYCDGREGTLVVNNGQYNITSTDAQFTAACTN